ncbi:hypothetical protein [Aestuariivirga sp.]|uniref:hypothetical protein n=1 Tax=Aestuariivirga sp. TaxID=2650926 RepID=UPI003BAC364C
MFDAKWLDVLRWPLRHTIPIAVASTVLLIMVYVRFLDLGQLGPYGFPVLAIVSVLSCTIVVVGAVNHLLEPVRQARKAKTLSVRRQVRRQEEEAERTVRNARILKSLDHLSREEIRVLIGALEAGSPTFYGWAYASNVAMLQGKNLVWTPGGAHNQDHYPFCFHDFVWDEIVRRREEFTSKWHGLKAAEKKR